MSRFAPQTLRGRLAAAGLAASVLALATGLSAAVSGAEPEAQAELPQAAVVSVATVEPLDLTSWNEFSGRLEAVGRADIRPRVAGLIEEVHFREGALVQKGDLLFTIDREPYAAEVARAEAELASATSRYGFARTDLARARQLVEKGTISRRTLDERANAFGEAEAALHAAQAALKTTKLNLEYTEVRAPIAGRVGKAEITAGNLVSAGPNAPILTTLVSVSPIYASFNADERVVTEALQGLKGTDAHAEVNRIPVRMGTSSSEGTPIEGRLQLIDNQVDIQSGTIRVRAVFDNEDGSLIPGQFARLRMGTATSRLVLAISERAVGADQDKQFVLVVDDEDRVVWREVKLGAKVQNLREVTSGLSAGERIIVNGLQRVRPGDIVEPQLVSMTPPSQFASAGDSTARLAQ